MRTRSVVVLATALAATSVAHAETSVDLSAFIERPMLPGVEPLSAPAPVPSPPRVRPVTERTPTLRIGRPMVPPTPGHRHRPSPTIDDASITLALAESTVTAHVSLTLNAAAGDLEREEAMLALEVPRGARVTGLAIKSGARKRGVIEDIAIATGVPMPIAEASAEYRKIVEQVRDPALLEWTGTRAGHDKLALHVYPISPREPITIELELAMPRGEQLVLDPDGQAIAHVAIDRDGAQTQWSALHARRAIALGDAPGTPDHTIAGENLAPPIDRTMSLFAGVPVTTHPLPREYSFRGYHRAEAPSNGGKRSIRGVVHTHDAQLRRCYMVVAQSMPSLAGTLTLHLMIERDGTVAAAIADGDLDNAAVRSCVEAEAKTWQFMPDDGMTQVNYPLAFKLAD